MTGLRISEGGAAAVDTRVLVDTASRLDGVRSRLHDHAVALALPPLAAGRPGRDGTAVALARGLLETAADAAQGLASDLRRAADEYDDGERVIDRCIQGVASDPAADDADGADLLRMGAADMHRMVAVDALLAVGASAVLHPTDASRQLLSVAVREAVAATVAEYRPLLPGLPDGDDGTREVARGLIAAIAVAASIAPPGLAAPLADAPAHVHEHADRVRPAPSTVSELAARIPDPVPGQPQMRVEEYRRADGGRRFVAYIGGMETLSPVAGEEDFDVTAAATAFSTEGGSAVQAARDALHDAGTAADDEVYVVGYSMGGIVARSLGDDPSFRVEHELTFGSPVQQLPLRHGIEGVSVEHVDDPVPALGGSRPTGSAAGAEVVVRGASTGSEDAAPDALAAHQLPEYRDTAAEMDASRSPQLAHAHAELHEFLRGATPVASHLYRAERR